MDKLPRTLRLCVLLWRGGKLGTSPAACSKKTGCGAYNVSTLVMLSTSSLWEKLHSVQLTQQPDQIKWCFPADGNYSSRSAYAVQFRGSHPDFTWPRIWKLKVENKCKFFLWLLLPWKIMTEGRIISRGGQANPISQLCITRPDTIPHLAANCSYTQSVW